MNQKLKLIILGYYVNEIDSGLSEKRGHAVLDRLVWRPLEDSAPILQVEPLTSLILDKWDR